MYVRTINDLLDIELNVVKPHILRIVKFNNKLEGFYLSKIRENTFEKFLLQIYDSFYLSITIFPQAFQHHTLTLLLYIDLIFVKTLSKTHNFADSSIDFKLFSHSAK